MVVSATGTMAGEHPTPSACVTTATGTVADDDDNGASEPIRIYESTYE